MKEYIVKRVFLAVVTIFVISAITFFAMNLIPGGPFNTEKALSPAVQKTLEERYNLDKPVYVQFGMYLKNLMHGDWGVSLKSGRDIRYVVQIPDISKIRRNGSDCCDYRGNCSGKYRSAEPK